MSRSIQILWAIGVLAVLNGCASSHPTREMTPTSPGSGATASGERPMMGGNANGMMGDDGKGMMGGMMGGGMMSSGCPMNVPGTSVAAADTEGGIALTFTTTKPSEVAELRNRVKRMADMHNGGMMSGGMMGGGMMGGGMMGGGKGMMEGGQMPSATAAVEEVEGGARLVFKPKEAAQLQALRDHVKQRAERMQQGQCPMMAAHDASGEAK